MLLKTSFYIIFLMLFGGSAIAQNGKITERKRINLLINESLKDRVLDKKSASIRFKEEYNYLNSITLEEITYESNGNKVKGYLAYPKAKEKYPAIIYNRGGNLNFGALNIYKATFILARLASWGYVVVGSQYSGNAGGTGGKDEFGGAELNDILNLVPLLGNMENADTTKLGLYGWSRGGMMTYITLRKSNRFKAAVVGGGLSDLYMMKKTRPVMEEVYVDLIPNYAQNIKKCLDDRSAIRFADKISKNTPILMVHGTADWRVVPEMALDLSKAFIKAKIPHRLVLFEGGDHGLNEFDNEVDKMVKDWFDRYLKKGEKVPDLTPHGK